MQTLTTYESLQSAGIPATSRLAQEIGQVFTGQSKVDGVFDGLAAITTLFEEAAKESITWMSSTTTIGNLPVMYLQQGLGSDGNSVVMTLVPLPNVLTGQAPPPTFLDDGGNSRYCVATVELIVSIAGDVSYVAVVNVGVSTATPPSTFTSVDWEATLAPVLPAIASTIDSAYLPANETDATARGYLRAEPAGATSRAGLTSVVGASVAIVMLAIKVVKMVFAAIKHPTAFENLFINFSQTPVTFSSVYSYDVGQAGIANTLGRPLDTLAGFTLPPPVELRLNDKTQLSLVQLATVVQVSQSLLHGTGISWVTSGGAVAAGLINTPHGGDNTLNAQPGYKGDAAQYWDSANDKQGSLPVRVTLADQSTLNLMIDAVSGKNPGPDGVLTYFYYSIVSFA